MIQAREQAFKEGRLPTGTVFAYLRGALGTVARKPAGAMFAYLSSLARKAGPV